MAYNSNKVQLLKTCEVKSVIDDSDGCRIKVHLPEDNVVDESEIPYAFPLMPKMFQSKPKVGECVLILCAESSNGHSDRFYIGPVISQPQFKFKDPYNFSARAFFNGSIIQPSKQQSRNPDADGVFPSDDDVAIIGRDKSDIILKNNDLRIRCGVSLTSFDKNSDTLLFNNIDPAYIKLSHTSPIQYNSIYGDKREFSSAINLVADKINILSHQSNDYYKLTDKNDLITEAELQNIVNNAHEMVYGDKLVDFLRLIVTAILTHTHPYSGLPVCQDKTIIDIAKFDFKTILSDSIRLS